jgi:hypothetical protein
MRGIILVILMGLCEMSIAQVPPKPSPPTTPDMGASTTIALQALAGQKQQLIQAEQQWNQEVQAIDAEVRKTHPGFHVDPQSVKVVKDVEVKK